jgi:hypothetical protein
MLNIAKLFLPQFISIVLTRSIPVGKLLAKLTADLSREWLKAAALVQPQRQGRGPGKALTRRFGWQAVVSPT